MLFADFAAADQFLGGKPAPDTIYVSQFTPGGCVQVRADPGDCSDAWTNAADGSCWLIINANETGRK